MHSRPHAQCPPLSSTRVQDIFRVIVEQLPHLKSGADGGDGGAFADRTISIIKSLADVRSCVILAELAAGGAAGAAPAASPEDEEDEDEGDALIAHFFAVLLDSLTCVRGRSRRGRGAYVRAASGK